MYIVKENKDYPINGIYIRNGQEIDDKLAKVLQDIDPEVSLTKKENGKNKGKH